MPDRDIVATSVRTQPPLAIDLTDQSPSGTLTPSQPNHEVAPPPSVVAPLEVVDGYLDVASSTTGLPVTLVEAIRYSFLGPGKRLRPLLVWHCSAAVGGDPRASLPAAAAVEFIHAFSLVHDDLPGIDNDDLRRGRPTLHRQTSEAMAILAGDAMLTLAFETITERVSDPLLSRQLIRELVAGTSEMIAGQVYDTLGGFEAGTTMPRKLEVIHAKKTGALIRAACRMGALCGLHHLDRATAGESGESVGARQHAAPSPALDAITRYAEAIGLMFQIVDDLLDVTQTTDHLGKKAGKDIDAGKLTYPGVHGIEESRRHVRELETAALEALQPLGLDAEPLRQLASYMAIRTR